MARFVHTIGSDTLHGCDLPGRELDLDQRSHSLLGLCNAGSFFTEFSEKGRIGLFKQGFEILPIGFGQDHLLTQFFCRMGVLKHLLAMSGIREQLLYTVILCKDLFLKAFKFFGGFLLEPGSSVFSMVDPDYQ